jgi:hypothetical protein
MNQLEGFSVEGKEHFLVILRNPSMAWSKHQDSGTSSSIELLELLVL